MHKKLFYLVLVFCILILFLTVSTGKNLVFLDSGSYYKKRTDDILIQEEKKLTVWYTYAYRSKEEDRFLNKYIPEYEKKTGIKIYAERKDYASAIDDFMIAHRAGVAPDMIRIPNDRLGEIAEKGYLEILDTYGTPKLWKTYRKDALNSMVYNGKKYALPASLDCLVIVYNKKIFEEKKVPFPTENWTLEDLENTAKLLTDKSKGEYGLLFPATSSYWWFPFQYGFGGSIFGSEGTPTINTKESIEAAKFVKEIAVNYGSIRVSEIDMVEYFKGTSNYKAAIIISGPWKMPEILPVIGKENLGISILPKVQKTGRYVAPLLGSKGWAIYTGSLNKKDAFNFAEYLTSKEIEIDFAKYTSTLPSVIEAYEYIKEDFILQAVLEQVKYAQPYPTEPIMTKIQEEVTIALDLFLRDEVSAEDAFQQAQTRIMEYISEEEKEIISEIGIKMDNIILIATPAVLAVIGFYIYRRRRKVRMAKDAEKKYCLDDEERKILTTLSDNEMEEILGYKKGYQKG